MTAKVLVVPVLGVPPARMIAEAGNLHVPVTIVLVITLADRVSRAPVLRIVIRIVASRAVLIGVGVDVIVVHVPRIVDPVIDDPCVAPSFRMMTCDGACGFLFTPGDSDGLYASMQQSLQIDRNAFSAKVLEQFHSKLSFQAIALRLTQIISSA